jgi:AraC-like DNA-binding protein
LQDVTKLRNGRRETREPTIAAGFARGLYEFARARGADAGILAEAQLSPADLEDQDARIPLSRFSALMTAAKRSCADPALALRFGAEVDGADLSIVPLIGAAAATVADGFAAMNRYARLMVEVDSESERFQFVRNGDACWLVDARIDPDAFPELTEMTFARMAGGARQFGRGQLILEAEVTHAEPPYAEEYRRVIAAPVRFGAARNALRINSSILDEKAAFLPRYVSGLLSERAQFLLKELDALQSVRTDVEKRLIPALHEGGASMSVVATSMGMSRQTLFRRLKAEGASFEAVQDDLRRRLALHYLTAEKRSVNDTAFLVGFSDTSAFSRAFRRWTGATPRAFRDGGKRG